MILYYALTTYHIQCCLLHKMTVNRDKKAVLLLSDIHKNSVAFLSRYRECGVFDEVYLLEESNVNSRVKQNENKHRSKGFILNTACREIKKVLPVNVEKMDEVYLCPDHFPFGWYVIKNKIKYHCFEEGCGVLSDNEFMLSNMKRNKTQYKLMDTLGYFGSNNSCVEILADAQCQKEGYANPKMVDFSVKRTLAEMNNKDISTVLSFFGVSEKISNSQSNLSLILTQHMANLGIMPLSDQHLLYKLFADYFLEGTHIIVKPHPDDIAGRYKEIFGENSTVLPFAMPSELLPYTLDSKVDTAIAAYSTAVKNLGDFCVRMICFDNRIMTDFRHITKYYAALKLAENLSSGRIDITSNANEILLDELANNDGINLKSAPLTELNGIENVALISDNLTEEYNIENICNYLISLHNKGFIIFLNEDNKHIYFDGVHTEVFRFMRPVFLTQTDNNGNITEDVIYLYSTDENILKATESFELKKELRYTGITVDMHSISRSESEKIKMLEGILEATEERLKEYINNKKQRDDEIEKLKRGT